MSIFLSNWNLPARFTPKFQGFWKTNGVSVQSSTHQPSAAFAREVIALAVLPIENFLRVRTLRAIAHTAFARTVPATDFSGLVVGPALLHRSRVPSSNFAFLAFALLPVKAVVTGTHTANQPTISFAIFRTSLVTLRFVSNVPTKVQIAYLRKRHGTRRFAFDYSIYVVLTGCPGLSQGQSHMMFRSIVRLSFMPLGFICMVCCHSLEFSGHSAAYVQRKRLTRRSGRSIL